MTVTIPGTAFGEWLEDNPDESEATKLEALHECIIRTACNWLLHGEINKAWANKKLWSLGVKHHFDTDNTYELNTTIVADVKLVVTARDRADAMEKFKNRVKGSLNVANAEAPYAVKFVDGPEDYDKDAVNPDAPTTVADTLVKLRETIMLGNISGPRWDCDSGTNAVLAGFGLAELPERKKFKVSRPVAAEAYTTVEAYDEAGARKVADWRWADGHTAHTVAYVGADPTLIPEVTPVGA